MEKRISPSVAPLVMALLLVLILTSPTTQLAWAANITGTELDDNLVGTTSTDDIRGLGGNDTIEGLDGNDRLYGHEGDDVISGGNGADSIYGWAGDDRLYGDSGNDKIYGGLGNDRIYGDDGDDNLIALDGNDRLYGGEGADSFDCGKGIDIVTDYNPTEGDTVKADCEAVNDTSQFVWSELRGVNFRAPILRDDTAYPPDFETRSMEMLHDYGFNLVRVPFYWEQYENRPDEFMTEIELIAQTADENGIYVIYDFHQYFTSSHFAGGYRGFPPSILSQYPQGPDYDTEVMPFWTDFLDNTIIVDGESLWDLQADFIISIIQQVDDYDNVIGYEILNEPNLFDKSQYAELGTYHTYMTERLREQTDKLIVFDRETAHGSLVRQPSLEPLIVPADQSDTVYGPHLYNVPSPGSQAETQVERFKTWSAQWGTPVLIGEFAASTQADMDTFVGKFKDSGFAWTYWAWGCFACTEDRKLVDENLNPTQTLEYLVNSMENFY